MSHLNDQEKALFFKLYFDLLYCVNLEHKVAKGVADGLHPKSINVQPAIKVRDEMFANPSWIDEYLQKYCDGYTDEERDILIGWRRHFVKESFVIMKQLSRYTVFMASGKGDGEDDDGDDTACLYGVVGLNHPIADIYGVDALPLMAETVILPFCGKIVYDGMVVSYRISFGAGARRSFNESYIKSKETYGIATSLPFDGTPRPAPTKPRVQKPNPSKQEQDTKEQEIAEIITRFCEERLPPEFLPVCLHVLTKLRRKRPSPLLSGKANTWGCGIVYAVASNNFVFDRSQPYYMSAKDIAGGFGLAASTAQGKAAEISNMLKINYMALEYVIESMCEERERILNMMFM